MKPITTTIIAAFITLGAAAQCFNTEEEFKTYFKNNEGKLDPIEGIWLTTVDTSIINPDSVKSSLKFFIIKNKNHFLLCRLQGDGGSSQQISKERFTRKKKEGHYLYSKYSYWKGGGQQRQNGNSFTAPAILTDNRHLKITTERRVKTSVVPNSNSPGVFKEDKYEYMKLFPE